MAVTHPDLAKLFHPTKNGDHSPETLKAGTGIKLWWICDEGHEWQRDGYSMKILKSEEKCPHCRKEMPSK
jgi:rubrerythrin|tara:strand:- start:738 stop:947 length:210 start_codon:yes stop_codon:yes gene_type:complete